MHGLILSSKPCDYVITFNASKGLLWVWCAVWKILIFSLWRGSLATSVSSGKWWHFRHFTRPWKVLKVFGSGKSLKWSKLHTSSLQPTASQQSPNCLAPGHDVATRLSHGYRRRQHIIQSLSCNLSLIGSSCGLHYLSHPSTHWLRSSLLKSQTYTAL